MGLLQEAENALQSDAERRIQSQLATDNTNAQAAREHLIEKIGELGYAPVYRETIEVETVHKGVRQFGGHYYRRGTLRVQVFDVDNAKIAVSVRSGRADQLFLLRTCNCGAPALTKFSVYESEGFIGGNLGGVAKALKTTATCDNCAADIPSECPTCHRRNKTY